MARPLDRARSMPQLDRARSMPHIKGAHILRPCARCTGFQQQLERSQRANEATARAYAAAQAKRDEYEALLQAAQKKLDVQDAEDLANCVSDPLCLILLCFDLSKIRLLSCFFYLS